MAGVMESFKGAGVLGVVSFVLALVGNVPNWVAFTTSTWARHYGFLASQNDFFDGLGLWRYCSGGGNPEASVQNTVCVSLYGTNVAHFGAIQAFVTIGFVGFNIMFLIIILKMFTGLCSSVGDIDKVNAIQAIITGVCYLIGIIIFGAEYGDGEKTINGSGRKGDLGYCFFLAIVAMVLQLVVGVILLVKSVKTSP